MRPTRVAINGFGRMGRLAMRAAWGRADLEFAHVNELRGDAATAAHLLCFDSVHGRWDRQAEADGDTLTVDGTPITYGAVAAPGDVPWASHGAEIVLECSGAFRTLESLAPYFQQGVRKVIVAAPVKDDRVLNVVGVNDDRYDPAAHDVITRRPARRTASRRSSRSFTRASASGAAPSRRCTT